MSTMPQAFRPSPLPPTPAVTPIDASAADSPPARLSVVASWLEGGLPRPAGTIAVRVRFAEVTR